MAVALVLQDVFCDCFPVILLKNKILFRQPTILHHKN
jgi:hypothetical protein